MDPTVNTTAARHEAAEQICEYDDRWDIVFVWSTSPENHLRTQPCSVQTVTRIFPNICARITHTPQMLRCKACSPWEIIWLLMIKFSMGHIPAPLSPLTSPFDLEMFSTDVIPLWSVTVFKDSCSLWTLESYPHRIAHTAVVKTSALQYAMLEMCYLIKSIQVHQVEQDTSRCRHANSFMPLRWCDTEADSCRCRSDSYPIRRAEDRK